MFDVAGARYRTSALVDLARDIERLVNTLNSSSTVENTVPAGMTYLGQFLDHDMTFMRRILEAPGNEPVGVDSLVQQRNPSLDLDSLYGEGYEAGLGTTIDKHGRFIGPRFVDDNGNTLLYDLPRGIHDWDTDDLDDFADHWFQARIPDPRNDENFLVAQLHVLFMNLHNKLADLWYAQFSQVSVLANKGRAGLEAFEHARRELIFLYQLVIVNDFLKHFLDERVYAAIFGPGIGSPPRARLLQYHRSDRSNIPLEFAGAAFRFGHSLVRSTYSIKKPGVSFPMDFFFRMTGRGRFINNSVATPGRRTGPVSSKAFLRDHTINWKIFFDMEDANEPLANITRYISPFLIKDMRKLVNEHAGNNNLLLRNLLRGMELDLPSAQDVIAHLNADHGNYLADLGLGPLAPIDIANQDTSHPAVPHPLRETLRESAMDCHTPLWLYVLMEPQFNGSTDVNVAHTRLGPLGSIIIGETFRMLLEQSNVSIYREDRRLNPEAFVFFDATRNRWRHVDDFVQNLKMKDLIRFLYNP